MYKSFEGGYEVLANYRELDEVVVNLMEEAKKARSSSYSPYSEFSIGVAVLLSDGTVVHGSNQENIAFPAGLCAERVALHTVMQDHPEKQVVALAIIGASKDQWTDTIITPCGVCRQTIVQVVMRQEKSFPVYLGTEAHKTIYIPKAEYLLPLSFSHDDLKK